jgi:hypothetical protein
MRVQPQGETDAARKLGHDEMFHANRGQLVDSRRGLARLADSILGPYLA